MAHAQYPEKTGYYERKELLRLSWCIGFPGSLLVDGLQSAHLAGELDKQVSDGVIKKLLESKHLDHKLEKRFNHYPAHYNRKLFLKVMSLLRHKRLSFSEISSARVAFELYRSEDGGGMIASPSVVLQALNMLGRLMSPIRLETEILKQQAVVDFPSRIQLYEFLDLASRCTPSSTVEKEMASLATRDLTESSYLFHLPDSERLLMTKEERISAYLDKQYQTSLYKKVNPAAPQSSNTGQVLLASRVHRENSVADSRQQLHVLTPALEHSQQQLFKARNGLMVFSKDQLQAAESLHASRQSSRAKTRSNIISRADYKRSNVNSRAVRSRTGTRSRSNASSRRCMKAGINSIQQSCLMQEHSPTSATPQTVTEDVVECLPKSMSVPILPTLQEQNPSENTTQRAVSKLSTSALHCSGVLSILHPVVSEVDVRRHQGLMDELKWEELRQKWQQPTIKIQYRPRARSQTIL